jgi:hypothetical protein
MADLLGLASRRPVNRVEAIVTGDRDLLEHPELEPGAITPRDASGRLKSP